MSTLTEKVKKLVTETGCSMEDAMEAIEMSEGDYDKAIKYIEEKEREDKESYTVNGKDLFKTLKLLIIEGNVTKIRITKDNETLLNIPVNLLAVGSILMPYAPIIASIAALVTDCNIEVERKGNVVVDVNSKLKNAGNKLDKFFKNI